MPQNATPTQFTLSKQSDLFSLYGAMLNTRQETLETVSIDIIDHLDAFQLDSLGYALNDKQGPLFHSKNITFNIKAASSLRLLSLITENIPRSTFARDAHITDSQGFVKVHVAARRMPRVCTNVSTFIHADFDKDAPELQDLCFRNTGLLAICSPLNMPLFISSLDTHVADMQELLRRFSPTLTSVALSLLCPPYVHEVLKTLGRIRSLKDLQFIWPPDLDRQSQDLIGLQSAILRGLVAFKVTPELTIPGLIFSRDFFLVLGDSKGLRSLTVKETPPAWSANHQSWKHSAKFSTLERMNINCRLDLVEELQILIDSIPTLKHLVLAIPSLRSNMDGAFWLRTAEVFPNLNSLQFLVKDLHPAETRDWFDISNITALTRLEELVVEHPAPLEISDEVIAGYFDSWPLLSRLSLNPCPRCCSWNTKDGLPSVHPTWHIVTKVIRKKGVLKDVALYIGMPGACATVPVEYGPGVDGNRILERLTIGSDVAIHHRSLKVVQGLFSRAEVQNPHALAASD